MTTEEQEAEFAVGELYRDESGHEVWRIKEVETGSVLREGIQPTVLSVAAGRLQPRRGVRRRAAGAAGSRRLGRSVRSCRPPPLTDVWRS